MKKYCLKFLKGMSDNRIEELRQKAVSKKSIQHFETQLEVLRREFLSQLSDPAQNAFREYTDIQNYQEVLVHEYLYKRGVIDGVRVFRLLKEFINHP